jgi:hypothetical protein
MASIVTDPELLSQLNASGKETGAGDSRVTDPKLLEQLNAPAPSVAEDVAKSMAIAVPKAAIGWAGLPGDVAGYLNRGIDYALGRAADVTGYEALRPAQPQPEEPLLGSAQLQRGVEAATGPLYEPQTPPGQFAQTATMFGVGPRAGMVGRILTGLGSEAAGQITRQIAPEYEPYARVGTAVLGGVAGIGRAERAAQAAAIEEAPAEIKTGASGLYKELDQHATIPVGMQERSQYGTLMRQQLNRAGVRDFGGGEAAHKAVNNFITDTRDLGDLVAWRRAMRDTLYGKGEGRAARILTDTVDRAIDRVSPIGVGVLKSADREWSLAKLSQALDERFGTIESQTAAANSGANLDNKIRQSLASLQKNERAMSGFNDHERAMIQNIINGGIGLNALRRITNFLGGGGGLGHSVSTYIMHSLFGPVAGGVTLVGAPALKALENRIALRRLQNLRGDIAARSQFQQPFPSISPFYQRVAQGSYLGVPARFPGSLAPTDQQ